MALNRYKLGELIKQSELKNKDSTYDINDVKGISIKKEFIETKADMEGVSLKPYLVVKPDYFAYVTVTSRNGEKITLAHNAGNDSYIVSSSYIVFYITKQDTLLSDYLFMYFNRAEFDRYSRFNSWGSARETFSWEDMCDIEIELPSIEIQQKYVDIYNAMVSQQQNFERGLSDLKLTCDAYMDKLKFNEVKRSMGSVMTEVDKRNTDSLIDNIVGININKEFIVSVANANNSDLSKYKVIEKDTFAYSAMQTGRDECIRIALYQNQEPALISPAYTMLKADNSIVIAKYIMLWFSRKESDRYGWFLSDASIRASLDLERFFEIEIPMPTLEVQQSIVNIYDAYNKRKKLNEQMKQQIKDICPVLIKGSLEE